MANRTRSNGSVRGDRSSGRAQGRWFWLAFPATAVAAIVITLLIINQMKPSLNEIGRKLLANRQSGNDLLANIEGKPIPTYEVVGEAPTEAEASETIAAFFAAVEQEDWEAAATFTVGQASLQTDTVGEQYSSRRVSVDLQVEEPTIDSVSVGQGETRVDLQYGLAENSDTILGALRGTENIGETTFILVRTEEGVKIADTGSLWLGEST